MQLQQPKENMAGSDELYGPGGSTEHTTLLSSSSKTLMREDGYPRRMQPWPRPLVVALCILGIWRPRTAERTNRQPQGGYRGGCRGSPMPRVYSHQPNGDRIADSNGNTIGVNMDDSNGAGASADACSGDGGCDEYNDPPLSWSRSVGSEECRLGDMQCDICCNTYEVLQVSKTRATVADYKVKSLLFNALMVLYLISITGLMTYDFVVYVIMFWGKQQNTLFLVSYFTYLFQVFVVPVFGLLTRFMAWIQYLDSECIWTALHNDYIFKRSQYLHGSCTVSFLILGLFLAWPTGNGVMRIVYDYVYRPHGNAHAEISHWCALASYTIYGSFCYLVYVERRSFQNEFRVVAHFVSSNAPRGDASVDVCRDRLSAAYRQYRIMRDFVGIWMAVTMAVATWGITAHLTWNYVIFSYCGSQGGNQVGLPVLNLLIWSQKIMFFVLPSLAVGGINVDYMWMEFRYIMANHQRHRYYIFWRHVKKHMTNINLFGKGLGATLVFSALGLYLGLKLSDNSQNVAFWNGPGEFNMSAYCSSYMGQHYYGPSL